jgi:hypothetical protein
MAKSRQTFQKRQRENKLREKAQRKRERRQERSEKKRSEGDNPETGAVHPPFIEHDPESETDIEEGDGPGGSGARENRPVFQQPG